VLKGVLRVENLDDPSQYISAIFARTKKEYIEKTYDIHAYSDVEDFLEKYAIKTGKLLKKGEPDVTAVSKMILNDWVRGKIPYFVPPPNIDSKNDNNKHPTDNSKKPKSEKTPEVMAPKQKISSIRVREEFQVMETMNEDDDDVISSEEDGETGDDKTDGDGADDAEEEAELEWEDVVENQPLEKQTD